MTALYGEMERLCAQCDTTLPLGTYCVSCGEHVPTYEYPHGYPAFGTDTQSRIERIVLERGRAGS